MPRRPAGSRLGALLMAAAAACGGAGDPGSDVSAASQPAVDMPEGPAIVNDAWQIVKMAAAHGLFTIEVEVDDPEIAGDIARELIAPLKDRYSEVLVYVYNPGEGYGGYAPVMRIQWTTEGSYDELDYRRSEQ